MSYNVTASFNTLHQQAFESAREFFEWATEFVNHEYNDCDYTTDQKLEMIKCIVSSATANWKASQELVAAQEYRSNPDV